MGSRKIRFRCKSACLSLASAWLLLTNGSCASGLQKNVPPLLVRKLVRGRDSAIGLEMEESTYPFGNQREGRITTSFLGPLFHDHSWSARQKRRRVFFSPSLILSSTGGSSFLDESNVYDDEDLLKHLPSKGMNLAPKTRELLKRVTSQYVYGNELVAEVDDVLDVILYLETSMTQTLHESCPLPRITDFRVMSRYFFSVRTPMPMFSTIVLHVVEKHLHVEAGRMFAFRGDCP
jgi:hypothetical protein